MENFELTIRKSSDPRPKHSKTRVEDFNRPHYHQIPDLSPTVKEKHETQSNPTDQRTADRSSIQQISNPAVQSPSNNSPGQKWNQLTTRKPVNTISMDPMDLSDRKSCATNFEAVNHAKSFI